MTPSAMQMMAEPRQNRLRQIAENPLFGRVMVGLILLNAIVLGLETSPSIMADYGPFLKGLDHALLWIFVVELAIRLGGYGLRFFRDAWNVFDFVVVAIAFMPANEAFSVLRAARVLRVLRLISIFPRLRRVIEGLICALPGIGSIGAILLIVFYVFAVMATKLFAATHPEWFGSMGSSMFSLFQIMTLEGWADMVRDIAKSHPFAPAFFIIYILVATFTVLNLFIAVIVDAMQREHQADDMEEREQIALLRQELASLHRKIDALAK